MELDTAVREQAPVIAVIGNDLRWNAEHLIQLRSYGPQRLIGCELSPTARYDEVASALGGRVSRRMTRRAWVRRWRGRRTAACQHASMSRWRERPRLCSTRLARPPAGIDPQSVTHARMAMNQQA